MSWTLLIHVASTWAMVGLIWFVQIAHYPLFGSVGSEQFSLYEQRHQRLTTWVVAPLMLVELATAILLCYSHSAAIPAWQVWAGLALVVVLWLSTAVLQVPAHNQLSIEFSAEQHARLVNTNWLRTIVWSLRGVLVLMLLQATARG